MRGTVMVWCLLFMPSSLKFRNSMFYVESEFICYLWISERTAIISVCSINWMVFKTEMGSAYCALRTESLNTHHFNLNL